MCAKDPAPLTGTTPPSAGGNQRTKPPSVGGKKIITCSNGKTVSCSSGTRDCFDDSPTFCSTDATKPGGTGSSGSGGSVGGGCIGKLITEGEVCKAKQQGSCDGNCEWKADKNTCDLDGMYALQLMSTGGQQDSGMGGMLQLSMKCGGVRDNGVCSADADCEWKDEENKCDVDGLKALGMMMSGGGGGQDSGMGGMLQLSMKCGGVRDKGVCSADADCEWKDGENKCDVDGLKALGMMMTPAGTPPFCRDLYLFLKGRIILNKR